MTTPFRCCPASAADGISCTPECRCSPGKRGRVRRRLAFAKRPRFCLTPSLRKRFAPTLGEQVELYLALELLCLRLCARSYCSRLCVVFAFSVVLCVPRLINERPHCSVVPCMAKFFGTTVPRVFYFVRRLDRASYGRIYTSTCWL